MMPVLRVLEEFVDSYGELGRVRTRRSGRRRTGKRLTRELPDSTLTVVAMLPRPIGSPGA